nr:helix-turn-helix transcriptional regulator [uncultured Brumimicrobium sp.]
MSDLITNAFNEIDPRNEKFIEKNTDIVEEIYALMEQHGVKSQKELAKLLGKKESEVSKLLTGIQNMTLRSITNLEVALGTDIIMTASKAKEKFRKNDDEQE